MEIYFKYLVYITTATLCGSIIVTVHSSMRGILSEAMVMCAFTLDPETSQFIDPPPGSIIGERITFEGYEGQHSLVYK